jgi:hypothetical protein
LRNLITLKLRTRNPFYLGVMAVAGLLGLLPGLFMLLTVYEMGATSCCGLPAMIPGGLLLANLIMNLKAMGESADAPEK